MAVPVLRAGDQRVASGNSNVTSLSIAPPTTIVDDDILLIVLSTDGNSSAHNIAEAGWAVLHSPDGVKGPSNRSTLQVFWKRASAESGNYTIQWTGVQEAIAWIGAFSGVSTATDPIVNTTNSETSASPTIDPLTIVLADTVVICCFAADDDDQQDNAGYDADYVGILSDESSSTAGGCSIAVQTRDETVVVDPPACTWTLNASEEVAQSAIELSAVAGLTPVTKVITGRFDIAEFVTKLITGRYDIIQFVTKAITGRYDILLFATKLITGRFDIAQFVTKTFTGRYDIFQLATKVITGRYDIITGGTTPVTKVITGRFDIAAFVTKLVIGRYDIVQFVTKTITGRYDIFVFVTKTITGRFDIAEFVNKIITGRYDIVIFAKKVITGRYDILVTTVTLERSSVVVSIAKGLPPTANIVLGTVGGALQPNGIDLKLLEVTPNYKVAINMVHDATSTTDLEYSHSEITVTKGASISLDNVLGGVAGAIQACGIMLVDSTPTTDTYLVVVVHLNA